MPPRTRKSTETQPPAPSLEDAAATTEEGASQGAETEDTTPTPEAPSGPDESAAPPESVTDESGEDAADNTPRTEAATYHWETVAGAPADPCRLCPPGGPPPGVGSYGCPHGQWVRVQDTD